MAYRLLFDDENGVRRTLSLTSEATVGRSAEGNAIRLGARNVSRRHARFTVVDGNPFVEDPGSLNGTFVNGVRLRGRRRLRDGDVVRIGDHTLLVETWTSEDTAELTPGDAGVLARPAPDETESTIALPTDPPRSGRLREALAKALRALSGRDVDEE